MKRCSTSLIFFSFLKFYFNQGLITLQYCSGFCHTLTWISHGCSCVPHPEPPPTSPPSHPSGSSQCTSPEHPVSCMNLDWWSVSHMIIYMFQCYSLKSSHPRVLPQSPKVCSLHLCLFCCLAYGVIVTIFLKFHIHVLIYHIGIFLSDLLHSVWWAPVSFTSLELIQMHYF